MAKNARILVVCGTGIATSTAAEYKIKDWLGKRGYNLNTTCCIAAEVNSKAKTFNPHVIVTTTKLKISKVEKEGLLMVIRFLREIKLFVKRTIHAVIDAWEPCLPYRPSLLMSR